MENASKALIMAASVLIGVVIMSLAVYLYVSFSSSTNEIEKQMEAGQLQQFNNQFTSYEGRKDLTIYDVITVTNLARENNTYYGLTESSKSNFYITVKRDGEELQEKKEEYLSGLLNNEQEMKDTTDDTTGNPIKELKKYNCKVSFNSDTNRVNEIVFTTKP